MSDIIESLFDHNKYVMVGRRCKLHGIAGSIFLAALLLPAAQPHGYALVPLSRCFFQ